MKYHKLGMRRHPLRTPYIYVFLTCGLLIVGSCERNTELSRLEEEIVAIDSCVLNAPLDTLSLHVDGLINNSSNLTQYRRAYFHFYQSLIFFKKRNIDSSIQFCDTAIKQFEDLTNLGSLNVEQCKNSAKAQMADCLFYKKKFNKAREIGTELSTNEKMDVRTKCIALNVLGKIHLTQRKYDSAAFVYTKFSKAAENNKGFLGTALANLGVCYLRLDSNHQAVRIFKRSIEMDSSANDLYGLSISYKNLSIAYKRLGQLQKSISALISSKKHSMTVGNDNRIAKVDKSIADLYFELGDLKSTSSFLHKSLSLCSDSSFMHSPNSLLGLVHNDHKNFDSASYYARRGVSLATKYGTAMNKIYSRHCYATILFNVDSFPKARELVSQNLRAIDSLNLSFDHRAEQYSLLAAFDTAFVFKEINPLVLIDSISSIIAKRDFLRALSDHYTNLRDFKAALEMFARASVLNDSLRDNENLQFVQRANFHHQNSEKEQKIALLEKEQDLKNSQLKQKNQLLYGGSISMGLVSLLALLAIYNQRKRQRLQKELLATEKKHLNQQLQLEVVNAEIRTQEAERQRISQELHDGVSASLAALRWSINKEIPGNKNAGKLYTQFEEITHELRSLSHRLHSPELTERPLISSLNSFLSKYEGSTLLIDLQLPKEGLPTFDEEMALTLYRMVQEITNNCVKHAEATELLLTFSLSEDIITLVAIDNGKGFDSTIQPRGTGLKNMKRRAEAMRGRFNVSPRLGVGTTINIQLPLQSIG